MIDLTKLEYGVDYFALPPKTVVFLKPYSVIIEKLNIEDVNGKQTLKLNENNSFDTNIILTENGFNFG